MKDHDVADIRRNNLRLLIQERYNNVNAAFSRATGRDPNLINLILSSNLEIRRNMGERLARIIETAQSLPEGWLDIPRHNGTVERIQSIPIAPLNSLNSPVLERMVFSQDVVARHIDKPTSTNNLRAAYALDNEMTPSVGEGDLLFVDTGVTEFDRPGVYVIVREKDVFVRRVSRPITGGIRISADSDPRSGVDAEAGQFGCAGRVVGCMRFSRI
jgi:hypothetical protein